MSYRDTMASYVESLAVKTTVFAEAVIYKRATGEEVSVTGTFHPARPAESSGQLGLELVRPVLLRLSTGASGPGTFSAKDTVLVRGEEWAITTISEDKGGWRVLELKSRDTVERTREGYRRRL